MPQPQKHTLPTMFSGMFRKQGYQTTVYECLDIVEFNAPWITGMILFRDKKHHVRWKMRAGYAIFDVPVAPGWTSAEFHSAGELLNFLQRRLVWKKQK